MDLPKFVAVVGDRELSPMEDDLLRHLSESPTGRVERPKVLLLGNGPFHSRILQTLLDLDFADVEQRCLNDMVIHGRGFSRITIDEFGSLDSVPIPIRDVYDWKQEPADGLHRRKEPKGPRGRWGKL